MPFQTRKDTINRKGKPKGTKNRRTIELELAQKQLQQAVFSNLKPLVGAAIQSALGEKFMYRIDRDENNNEKHVQLTDSNEIRIGLDAIASGEFDDAYYYITTKPSNPQSFKELMDRGFGKAPQQINGQIDVKFSLSELAMRALERRGQIKELPHG